MAQRVLSHGSAVALRGRGLLIVGGSGAGKSRLAASMISLGAGLVADDQVQMQVRGSAVWMSCPPAIRGMIEARGIGLLACPAVGDVALHGVVDLSLPEPARLPEPRFTDVLGHRFPLLATPPGGHDAAAVMLWLRYGRRG